MLTTYRNVLNNIISYIHIYTYIHMYIHVDMCTIPSKTRNGHQRQRQADQRKLAAGNLSDFLLA